MAEHCRALDKISKARSGVDSIPAETYILILYVSLPSRSSQLGESRTNWIKHDNLPE